MSLESASWATQFNTANPLSSDPRSQGDDHLRMIKSVVQNELAVNNREWIYTGDSVIWRASNRFSLAATDATSTYKAGRLIKVTGGTTGTALGIVTSSTYSAATTVNIGTLTSLANETLTTYVSASVPDSVSVAEFGALGDGSTDDTAAIQAAIDASSEIHCVPGKTYKITSTLDMSAGNKRLIGHGATIDQTGITTGNKWAIKAAGALGGTSQVLTADGDEDDYSISVASVTGFAADAYVLVRSDVHYPFAAANVDEGEIKRIRSAASTTITFTTPLLDTYTTGNTATVQTVSWVENVHIEGLKFQGTGTAATNERGIVLQYVDGFSVRDCELIGQDQYQVEVNACINGTVDSNRLDGVFYDGVTGTIFYGIVLLNSTSWVTVSNNIGTRHRHLIITTGNTGGQGFYGRPVFCTFSDNIATDGMSGDAGRSYAYEFRIGRHLTCTGNSADGCYSGIQLDDIYNMVIANNNITNYAFAGIEVGESGDSGMLKDILITGNLISGYTGELTASEEAGIRVAATGSDIQNVHIVSNTIQDCVVGASGRGISVGAAVFTNCSIVGNSIDAGVTDSNGIAGISLAIGTEDWLISGNHIYRFQSGIALFGDDCAVKGNYVDFPSTSGSGQGVYSDGSKNVISDNTLRHMNVSITLAASSASNLCVNNQSVDTTTDTPSDSGTGNTVSGHVSI